MTASKRTTIAVCAAGTLIGLVACVPGKTNVVVVTASPSSSTPAMTASPSSSPSISPSVDPDAEAKADWVARNAATLAKVQKNYDKLREAIDDEDQLAMSMAIFHLSTALSKTTKSPDDGVVSRQLHQAADLFWDVTVQMAEDKYEKAAETLSSANDMLTYAQDEISTW